MDSSGGEIQKKKIVDCGYKFPPKRTRREWNERYKSIIRSLESIQYDYMGKPSVFSGEEK